MYSSKNKDQHKKEPPVRKCQDFESLKYDNKQTQRFEELIQ